METLASLRIHPNKATKRVVEMLINTSTQVLHQLGFNFNFQPSLRFNPQTYRCIIATSWSNCYLLLFTYLLMNSNYERLSLYQIFELHTSVYNSTPTTVCSTQAGVHATELRAPMEPHGREFCVPRSFGSLLPTIR